MSGRAKFVHWMVSPFSDIPSEPMFNVVANDKGLPNGSTIGGGTLLTEYGINLPLFPDLATWQRETAAKRKCFRCWSTVKGANDLLRHREVVHKEKFRHAPNGLPNGVPFAAILLLALLFSGCNTLKRAIGESPDPISGPIRSPRVYSITGTWNGGYTTNAVSCGAVFSVYPTNLGDPSFHGMFNDGASGCIDGAQTSNFTGVMDGKDFTIHLVSADTTCPGTFDITGIYETNQNGDGSGISFTGIKGSNCRGDHTTISGHFN